VLALTDLAYKADSEVNGLSRGMQQRLSIARVLLHDPKVLLLDEPASGLDPRARIEIRELLKELHRMGKTILISSHILLELADLVTKVGIIEQGEMKFTGTIPEIMQRAGTGDVVRVAVAARGAEAAEVLEKLPGVTGIELDNGGPNRFRVTIEPDKSDPAIIAQALVNCGFQLIGLEDEKVNLETAFMRLTKGLVH